MNSFRLQPFRVNGKTISRLSGSTPPEIPQEEAIEQIKIWSKHTTLNRNAKDAQAFFREECNEVFQNGVQVQTQNAEIEEG